MGRRGRNDSLRSRPGTGGESSRVVYDLVTAWVEACRQVGITRKTGCRGRAEVGGLVPVQLAEAMRSNRHLPLLESPCIGPGRGCLPASRRPEVPNARRGSRRASGTPGPTSRPPRRRSRQRRLPKAARTSEQGRRRSEQSRRGRCRPTRRGGAGLKKLRSSSCVALPSIQSCSLTVRSHMWWCQSMRIEDPSMATSSSASPRDRRRAEPGLGLALGAQTMSGIVAASSITTIGTIWLSLSWR